MDFSDLVDFTDLIDIAMSWRFILGLVIGSGVGMLLYVILGGGIPGIVAMFVSGLVGAIAGFVWERRHAQAG